LQVDVSDSGSIVVTRVSDATRLLVGTLPIFAPASCGHGYFSFMTNFTSATSNWYGLGQLENSQGNCQDGTPDEQLCGTPLNRKGRSWRVQSAKYYIAIPWLFNRDGYGMFLNQPGDGQIDLSSGVGVSFGCQKQMDVWFTAAAASASNQATAVYSNYAHATGLPAPLPEKAALYWQSRNRYKDQAEVIQLAKNFSARKLELGVIVIDLGLPDAPPYYRLDPTRFPDIPAMVSTVRNLTGAVVMPNLKPTSVGSSVCPACGLGRLHDGKADDGNIDPSIDACRQCVWSKRLKPQLFDRGIVAYWLDDDEANKFHPHLLPPSPVTADGKGGVRVDCTQHPNLDIGGAARVGPPLNGTTPSTCCTNCTAHRSPSTGEADCAAWVFAQDAEPKSGHAAGSCWLLSAASTPTQHANRISGGDMSVPTPAPKGNTAFACGPAEYCG
jgi:hypothetical protein